jgi:membrane protein implicated in regulation of membrane protease activity
VGQDTEAASGSNLQDRERKGGDKGDKIKSAGVTGGISDVACGAVAIRPAMDEGTCEGYGTCLVALDGSRPRTGLLELVVASFFVIWFGLGALLVGFAMLALPIMAFTAQILLWTAASVAMTVLWFRVFLRDGGKTRSGQADEALGEIGVLVRAVEPLGVESARGEVRFQKPVMGSDVWPCLADEAIAAGERVRVLAVDGQILKVGKY